MTWYFAQNANCELSVQMDKAVEGIVAYLREREYRSRRYTNEDCNR